MLDYLITALLQSTPLLAQRTDRDEAVECAGADVGGRGVELQHRLVHYTTLGVNQYENSTIKYDRINAFFTLSTNYQCLFTLSTNYGTVLQDQEYFS